MLTVEKRIRQSPCSTTDQDKSYRQSHASAAPAAGKTAEIESSASSTVLEDELEPLPLFSGVSSHNDEVVVESKNQTYCNRDDGRRCKKDVEVRKCCSPPAYTAGIMQPPPPTLWSNTASPLQKRDAFSSRQRLTFCFTPRGIWFASVLRIALKQRLLVSIDCHLFVLWFI